MTDPMSNDAAPGAAPVVPAPPPRRRGRWLLALLLLLILLAGLGYAGWFLQAQAQRLDSQARLLRHLSQNLAELQRSAETLDTRQADLAGLAQRNSAELADFGQRIEQHDQIVGSLHEQLAGGRSRFELAAVENLLLLANDRLQLARDTRSALRALDEADARLGNLRDPRLFNVRQALASERAALLAVPEPDAAGIALRLSSLAARVERLPLRARAPDRFQPTPAPAPRRSDSEPPSRWQRLQAAVGEALQGLFTLRRRQGPTSTLLAPQEEALVHQVLMLRVEAARVALLRGDSVNFRDSCAAAARWLREYFRPEDAAVQTALAELERLQPLELAPPLPDLTRSLTLLRAHLDAGAR